MLQIQDTIIVKPTEIDDISIKAIKQENIKLTQEIESIENDILVLETVLQSRIWEQKKLLQMKKETIKNNRELIKEYREMKPVLALQSKKVFVNITWEWPVIHREYTDWLEYNEDRGDRIFDTLKEAKEYVKLLSNE